MTSLISTFIITPSEKCTVMLPVRRSLINALILSYSCSSSIRIVMALLYKMQGIQKGFIIYESFGGADVIPTGISMLIVLMLIIGISPRPVPILLEGS